jgi:hypothetical protein
MLYQPEERRKNLQCLLSHPSILIVVRLYPMNALPLYASHVIEGPNIQQLTTVPTLYLFFLYIKDLALPAIHFLFTLRENIVNSRNILCKRDNRPEKPK